MCIVCGASSNQHDGNGEVHFWHYPGCLPAPLVWLFVILSVIVVVVSFCALLFQFFGEDGRNFLEYRRRRHEETPAGGVVDERGTSTSSAARRRRRTRVRTDVYFCCWRVRQCEHVEGDDSDAANDQQGEGLLSGDEEDDRENVVYTSCMVC